jgi:hypothetical protein
MSKDKPKKGTPREPKGGWRGKAARLGAGKVRRKKGR